MTDEHSGTGDTAPQTPLAPDDSTVSRGDDTTVSLSEAAECLGVSERTVLRRIQQGKLPAYKVDTIHGPAWRITLDRTGDTAPPAAPVTRAKATVSGDTPTAPRVAVNAPETVELVRLVDRLQQEAREATIRATWLEAQLQQAQERIKLLEAPRDEPVRRPWWRRLFS